MKQEFYETSKVTGKRYNVFDSIKILNIPQAIYYLRHNVPLQDLFISKDRKFDKDVMVFVFLREDTKPIFDMWCNGET